MLCIGPFESASRIILDLGTFGHLEGLSVAQKSLSARMGIMPFRPTFNSELNRNKPHQQIADLGLQIVPSTFGCHTPEEAVSTAHLAAKQFDTSMISLQVTGCPKNGFPDGEGTLEAARELVHCDLDVIPLCSDDPTLCKRLAQIGCAALVVLSATPGSTAGIQNPHRIRLIREAIDIPLILSSGFGCASDVTLAMELGADAVVIDAAAAQVGNPDQMPRALALAVQAGRIAHEAVHAQPNASGQKEGTMPLPGKGASAWR